jgi:hypothetical protein
MRLGEGKKFIEGDWKRQAAYAFAMGGNLVTYLGERRPGWTFCALELDAKRIGNTDKIRRSFVKDAHVRQTCSKPMSEFVFRRRTQQDLPEGSACSNRPARPNMPNEKKQ